MKYINLFDSYKIKTFDRKLFNFLKELSKPVRGMNVKYIHKSEDTIVFNFYFGETLFIDVIINLEENCGNILFLDSNIEYEKNLTQLKDYILSKLTYKKFKKTKYEYTTKYYFKLDDKAANVEYSVDDFELYKNVINYNL